MAVSPHEVVRASSSQLKSWSALVGRFARYDDGVAAVGRVLAAAARNDAKATALKNDQATIVAAVIGLCEDAAEATTVNDLVFRKSAGSIAAELPMDFRSAYGS